MISLTKTQAIHKAWLYRTLIAIVDNEKLSELYFKGGTAASMAGFLDRFSIDLDFDYVGKTEKLIIVRQELKKIFKNLGLEIKDESKKIPQFVLRYPSDDLNARNTLKINLSFPVPKANQYKAIKLKDIERFVLCQDRETMFANKLVAVMDRFDRNDSIAGRDIYDIHHFFLNAYNYNQEVIIERTKLSLLDFFKKLSLFIEDKVTLTLLDQDLNPLLAYNDFKKIRKTLKLETQIFINDEINRLKALKDGR